MLVFIVFDGNICAVYTCLELGTYIYTKCTALKKVCTFQFASKYLHIKEINTTQGFQAFKMISILLLNNIVSLNSAGFYLIGISH